MVVQHMVVMILVQVLRQQVVLVEDFRDFLGLLFLKQMLF